MVRLSVHHWRVVVSGGVIPLALRDLPWRRTRDPWAVLVAEVMAQQTGVERVIPAYSAFIGTFPDVAACAVASRAEVLQLWSGLGYNRRAVNLHRCAERVVEQHDAKIPADLQALLALPGIGPYTARAVLAFAFEQPIGVVDTNVGRVLARWTGRRLSRLEAQAMADALVPADEAWLWNQTIMELGATVCSRRKPSCEACPATERCRWWTSGRPAPDPAAGSAGVSRGQSRFEGSDRQGRGRLVDALRVGPVRVSELADVMQWPADPDRAARVAASVADDGLAIRDGDVLRLPTN